MEFDDIDSLKEALEFNRAVSVVAVVGSFVRDKCCTVYM